MTESATLNTEGCRGAFGWTVREKAPVGEEISMGPLGKRQKGKHMKQEKKQHTAKNIRTRKVGPGKFLWDHLS